MLEEPKRVDMSESIAFGEEGTAIEILNPLSEFTFPSCGTAGCIAGWACLLDDPIRYSIKDNGMIPSWYIMSQDAANILGMEYGDLRRLFFTHLWPGEFEFKYKTAKTPQERANATSEMIDFFIKENT